MIKNIIFDFGDVFLTLDKSATDKHLKLNGINEVDRELIEINKRYEKGLISSEDFITSYLNRYPSLSKEAFVEAWNSILIEFPKERLSFLKTLKASGKFRLFLLSNTNELHIDWVKRNISHYNQFKSCFDQFYLSHEIHHRKPHPGIFEFVLGKNDLIPEQTLFIDDTLEHVTTAKSLGIHTWHLKAGIEDVSELYSIKSNLF